MAKILYHRKNLDQYRGFLPNLINENGLREVVNSMWKMIPWLSYLRELSQTRKPKAIDHTSLQSEVILFSPVRNFILSALLLVQNTVEILILLGSTFGFQQMGLVPILYDNGHQTRPSSRCVDAPTLQKFCLQIIDKISSCEDSTVALGLLDILSILSVREKAAIPYVHKAN